MPISVLASLSELLEKVLLGSSSLVLYFILFMIKEDVRMENKEDVLIRSSLFYIVHD